MVIYIITQAFLFSVYLSECSREHRDWRRGLWQDFSHLGGGATAAVYLCRRCQRLLWTLCSLRQRRQGEVPHSHYYGQYMSDFKLQHVGLKRESVFTCLLEVIDNLLFLFCSGRKCGDRRDGRGADPGWGWHHQSRHRTRWSQISMSLWYLHYIKFIFTIIPALIFATPLHLAHSDQTDHKQCLHILFPVCKSSSYPFVFLYRLCVYHPQEDRGGVPPAQRCDRVCRCSSRLGWTHHLCEWISSLIIQWFKRTKSKIQIFRLFRSAIYQSR